jgi:predicted  nucleic acid-binding Zn-ribbon protein
MARIADLWRLQETDMALDSRRGSLADAETQLGEPEDLVALQARVEELRSALKQAESAQRDVEIEADDLKAKIAPQETKLYEGTIKNPKELAGLQADIDQLKRHLSAVEDRDLAALAAVEAADTELRTASAELEAMQAAWGEEQGDLRSRMARLTAEITEYDEERNDRLEPIDAELLSRYEHIRQAHQGRAVAKLDRNMCLGCRISLPTNLVNKARAGNALVQCPNCERILYA